MENKLPVVSLVESGGANLNYAAEVFVDGARTFANQARLSAAGIPQITVVHGNATAGGAYQPGLSDYVVVVRERAKMFLAGPPLLKAATGEIATDEELGGAEMHSGTAGTAEYLAENDADGIRQARDLVKLLGWRRAAPDSNAFEPPRYDAEELLGVVPADAKKPYDVREIIARIADGSDFLDFKNDWDSATVCGWSTIEGKPVGIIGNNGPITPVALPKPPSSSSSVTRHAGLYCSFTTPPASWWVPMRNRTVSSSTARKCCRPWPTLECRRFPSWSVAPTVPATMPCAAAAWTRASSLPGPTPKLP